MAIEIDDKELLRKAEAGDASAQYDLAHEYRFGDGRDGEDEEGLRLAFEWYLKSAQQGFTYAECSLGDCYFYGYGTDEDLNKAELYLKRAADKGDPNAQWSLGDLYYDKEDYTQAVKFFTAAADSGNEYALDSLIWCYRDGMGVEKDDAKADELQKKLDAIREREKMLSKMSYDERYEFENREEFEKIGSVKTIENLALHYCAEKQFYQALKFIRFGIEKGSVECERLLGRSYMYGDGVELDWQKAKQIFEKLLDLGDSQSAKYIGDIYYYAFGGAKRDVDESLKWYKRAADMNNDDAKRQIEWLDKLTAGSKSFTGSYNEMDVSSLDNEYFIKPIKKHRKISIIALAIIAVISVVSFFIDRFVGVFFMVLVFPAFAIYFACICFEISKFKVVLDSGKIEVMEVHSIKNHNSNVSNYLKRSYLIKLNGYDKYNQIKTFKTPVLYDRDTACSLEKAKKVLVKKLGKFVIVVGLPKDSKAQ